MEIDPSVITFRKVGTDDIPLLVEYRLQFLRELQGPGNPEEEISIKNTLAEYFQSSLPEGSFIAWMAELDNQPIGFGGMVIQRIPAHFHLPNGLQGYILNMYTLPGHREQGIGAEILRRLVSEGKKIGLKRIYLNSTQAGVEIYKRNGFKSPDFPEFELLEF